VAPVLDDVAAGVALAVAGGDRRKAQDRNRDLAAVEVAGEGQRHAVGDEREDVRVVGEQDQGRVGRDAVEGGRQVGTAVAQVGEPRDVHVAGLDGPVLEHFDAGVAQRVTDGEARALPVVVAEHGERAER
jgi:hypothetical protein